MPTYSVIKIDLLTGSRSCVFSISSPDALYECQLFVAFRERLMKIYGFTYRYLIKVSYV